MTKTAETSTAKGFAILKCETVYFIYRPRVTYKEMMMGYGEVADVKDPEVMKLIDACETWVDGDKTRIKVSDPRLLNYFKACAQQMHKPFPKEILWENFK